MAYASSSSVQKRFKYDVFLSFRGEDTRNTFVDHLYHALQQKDINTYIKSEQEDITNYKKDERIEKVERISDEVIRSIEDSRFHIIVFSKNYADSSWCLEELLKIMECHKTEEQNAYAIFYDVKPTEVRNQSGAVGKAFAKHENEDNFLRWRSAMREAAGLVGWELKKNTNDGHEAKVIQEILVYISLAPSFEKYVVGMETRVKEIFSSLELGSNDVRMIGIKGIGGGGKTTLARAVFNHIYNQFEGRSFVENVREVSNGSLSGLKELQKQVLQDVSNEKSIKVTSVTHGINMMKKRMCSRKILIVLDDVNNTEQLKALAGSRNWFKPGSRIIITTRDEQVIKAHQVKIIHDVKLLSYEEAIRLFSRRAFKREIPDEGYEELSEKFVRYADGLPLTIGVLGSLLCERPQSVWKDAIERLQQIPLRETLKALEISYDSLEKDHKEIFLDVTCILKGETKDEAIRVLESFGFRAKIGLRVLAEKSLITISNDGRLGLHKHMEEMGKNIVRRQHPNEPYRHSRLWVAEEIEEILVKGLGTEATKSIKLEYELHPAIIMNGLRKMKDVRFLYVYDKCINYKTDEVDQYLPNTLRSLHWCYYPFWYLPKKFEANNLVNLELPRSNISQLWKDGEFKVLRKLKYLNLSGSKLRELDLEMATCLVELHLEECSELVKLRLPFTCPKLKYLNLSGSKLRELDLQMAPCIMEIHLVECSELVQLRLPVEYPKLKYLNLSGSKLSKLHLPEAPCLEELHLTECNYFIEFHLPCECPELKYVILSGSKLSNLDLGMAPNLEKLDLDNLESLEELTFSSKVIEHFPDSMCILRNLKSLELKSCIQLKQFPSNLDTLEHLEMLHLSDCRYLQDVPKNICNMKRLKYLHLPYCVLVKKLPEEIGSLKCLIELNIEGTGITDLPQSIYEVKGLCVVWSRGQLEFHGFTSIKKLSKYTATGQI